jgi:hypothetical protein
VAKANNPTIAARTPAASPGWPELLAALEAGDRPKATEIAYGLAIPAQAVEGFAIAADEAVELRQTLVETQNAAERLEDTRRRLAAVRAFVPATMPAAEERAVREAELALAETKLINDAAMFGVTQTRLAGLFATCGELFGVESAHYRATPRGRFGEWLQDRGITPKAGWWKSLGTVAPQRTIRIVAAHSGK